VQADLAGFKASEQADFITWFNDIKGQLSEDAAGNLQKQIGTLESLKTEVKTNLVNALNWVVGKTSGVIAKLGSADISKIGDGTVTGAIVNNKEAIEDVSQSLIPNYETTKTVLSDNSKASYTKKYVVNKDSWFACDHQSYNGYGWGNVFVNEIRVAGFRAMPIAYSSTTFFAPKGSTIIINGAGGMTVAVSEIG